MGNLSEHFSRHEFACHCGCGFDAVSPELVTMLEQIRAHFGPVIVNCGCRCPAHNKAVNGAAASQHMNGTAADIRIEGQTPQHVADYAETLLSGTGGIGVYSSFTHVDVRQKKGRWRG